jgi:hypothetical protein
LSERKAYAEPQLIEYGDLETLTRASGGEGNGADGQLQY